MIVMVTITMMAMLVMLVAMMMLARGEISLLCSESEYERPAALSNRTGLRTVPVRRTQAGELSHHHPGAGARLVLGGGPGGADNVGGAGGARQQRHHMVASWGS